MAEVAPVAAQAGGSPAARALPTGLDPDYVRALATVNADGVPQRWTGGAFHHCFAVDSEQELAYAQTAASRITEISGIQTTDSGPCNVEWVSDPAPGHTFAELHGDYTGIIYVKVFLRGTGTNSYPIILHEAGHVLGLNHSPRGEDLMNANTNKQRDFSRDELAVLAWIYGR